MFSLTLKKLKREALVICIEFAGLLAILTVIFFALVITGAPDIA